MCLEPMTTREKVHSWYARQKWKVAQVVGTWRERLRRRPVITDAPIPMPKNPYFVTRCLSQDCVKIGKKTIGQPRTEAEEIEREAEGREEDPEGS